MSGATKFAEVVNLADMQIGKALADDTEVFTPNGWVKHGDIVPGDFVFSPEGKPIKVLAVTGSSMQECYRVVFDKDVEIVASKDHLWQGYRQYRTGDKKASVKNGLAANEYGGKLVDRELLWTTEQIAAIPRSWIARSGGQPRWVTSRSFRIPLHKALELPERDDLLIDPHLLGVWLGDGNSHSGNITLGVEDKDWLDSLGGYHCPSNSKRGNNYGTYNPVLYQGLKNEGLFGNKHIPEKYLMAPVSQRLALLQGLMDTDGSALTTGNAEFVNTNLNLTDGVEFLLSSLGIKYKRTERVGKFNGVEYKPFVRLGFTAPRSMPVFTLERKLSRQREELAEQTTTRNVQYAEPVGLVSAQCVTVEGGMYLAGRQMVPTHNCDERGGTEEFLSGSLPQCPRSLSGSRHPSPR